MGTHSGATFQWFCYYVIFIDDCTRFTWYFPLRLKSDFLQCFIDFHKFVQTRFDKQIHIFQSDGGGEFSSEVFDSCFRHNGVYHQMSCPQTPEQNRRAERKHRNITELGLTMLFNSFGSKPSPVAVWLINRLLTRVFDMKPPFERLYGSAPTYDYLRVFGSRCFPYLWDYAKTKLDSWSLPCIFLGYCDWYNGYRCYHP